MMQELRAKIERWGYTASMDAAGNLIVPVAGNVKAEGLTVLAAHMDEIALVVSKVEADGRLRVVRSGGLIPLKMGERMVEIIGDQSSIQGVVSSGTGHVARIQSSPMPDRLFSWQDHWIVTGFSAQELEARGIHPGAAVVPVREGRGPYLIGAPEDPLLAAWTFDDRMGMVTLLRLLEGLAGKRGEISSPLAIAFTVHEEGGAHGAKYLCHTLRPARFIAVDGCPLAPEASLSLKGGPVIWVKDLKTNYNQALVQEFSRAAKQAGLPLQRAVLENAYSDASAAYDVGSIPASIVVGYVRENSHGFEVAQLKAFDQLLELLQIFMAESPMRNA